MKERRYSPQVALCFFLIFVSTGIFYSGALQHLKASRFTSLLPAFSIPKAEVFRPANTPPPLPQLKIRAAGDGDSDIRIGGGTNQLTTGQQYKVEWSIVWNITEPSAKITLTLQKGDPPEDVETIESNYGLKSPVNWVVPTGLRNGSDYYIKVAASWGGANEFQTSYRFTITRRANPFSNSGSGGATETGSAGGSTPTGADSGGSDGTSSGSGDGSEQGNNGGSSGGQSSGSGQQQQSSSGGSSGASSPAAIGGIVGGVLGLIIIVLCFALYYLARVRGWPAPRPRPDVEEKPAPPPAPPPPVQSVPSPTMSPPPPNPYIPPEMDGVPTPVVYGGLNQAPVYGGLNQVPVRPAELDGLKVHDQEHVRSV